MIFEAEFLGITLEIAAVSEAGQGREFGDEFVAQADDFIADADEFGGETVERSPSSSWRCFNSALRERKARA